jgi:hypothetical protein
MKQTYEKGLVVTDEEFGSINILNNDFHGEWNYAILSLYCPHPPEK